MKHVLMILVMLLGLCGCHNGYKDNFDNLDDYPESEAIKKEEVLFAGYSEPFVDADKAFLDFSHTDEGYFCASLKEKSDKKIKLRVTKDDMTYTYDLISEEMKPFSFNMNDGTYSIRIYEQLEDISYALVYSEDIEVKLNEENKPFLYPNQIVDYDESSRIVDISFDITKNDNNDLKRLYDIFVYTLNSLSYDYKKAELVKNIYVLPDIDESIRSGSGICFDYAATLTALCRIQGIPARVIVGYTDIAYHAWVEVYLEEYGWINPKMIFNSKEWTLLDPTFADTGSDYEGKYDEVYRY